MVKSDPKVPFLGGIKKLHELEEKYQNLAYENFNIKSE